MALRTAAEGLAYLASRPASTIRLGLDRMLAALEGLGHPERAYPILQVAGTNGKGSTCAFAAQVLHAHGVRVGRYTSPHLIRVNERIWVAGEDVADEVLGTRIRDVVTRLGDDAAGTLTYFELGTLAALWHFREERVEAAVLEVGLGGRLDATTAAAPTVTAVSALALDHTEWLGSTLAEVAGEKAAIFRPGVPAVASAQPPEAAAVLTARAQMVGAPLRWEGRDFSAEPWGEGGLRYRSPAGTLEVPRLALRGRHQIHNAALAVAALEELARGRWTLRPDVVAGALAATTWPGRLEEVAQAPRVLVDGAHNPAGVQALIDALTELHPGERPQLVFGVLADKDAAGMRALLFPRCVGVHLTPLQSPRAAPLSESETHARQLGIPVTVHDGVLAALKAAQRLAGPQGLVLCAGSLVLVGAVRQWARGALATPGAGS